MVGRCSQKSHLNRKMYEHLFSLEVKYSYQRYCPHILRKSRWGNQVKAAEKCFEVKLMIFRGIRLLILAQFMLSAYLVAAFFFSWNTVFFFLTTHIWTYAILVLQIGGDFTSTFFLSCSSEFTPPPDSMAPVDPKPSGLSSPQAESRSTLSQSL